MCKLMIRQSLVLHGFVAGLSLLGAARAVADKGDGGATAQPGSKAQELRGKFTHGEAAAENAVRQKAVEQAVSEVVPETRALARKMLEAKTRIAAWVEITPDSHNVTVHMEGREAEVCPLLGARKGKDPQGRAAEFSARWDGRSLVQTITNDEGKRTNTFAPQSDGSLLLSVEISSSKFKTPIRYKLTYRADKG